MLDPLRHHLSIRILIIAFAVLAILGNFKAPAMAGYEDLSEECRQAFSDACSITAQSPGCPDMDQLTLRDCPRLMKKAQCWRHVGQVCNVAYPTPRCEELIKQCEFY